MHIKNLNIKKKTFFIVIQKVILTIFFGNKIKIVMLIKKILYFQKCIYREIPPYLHLYTILLFRK